MIDKCIAMVRKALNSFMTNEQEMNGVFRVCCATRPHEPHANCEAQEVSQSEKRQVDFALAVKLLRENLPAAMEHHALQAQLQWHKFQRLKEQGFTEAQALELVKSL